MSIDNMELYTASLPDWAILDGCFDGNIRPTDIDGCVERNGQVLFLEHKSTPHARVKRGQERLFEALSASGHAVIVHWTEGDGENVIRIRIYWRGTIQDIDSADRERYRGAVRSWYVQADATL